MISQIIHFGDLLAIPFFLLMFLYFNRIKNKTPTEYILYMFSFFGLFADIYFSYLYLKKVKSKL